ncbi:hypothetical protein [uncultured Clostridium sp.]|uniref:hypothetical protein n=1 Tax=uncultured Clostridium sp. TaxID=59620 RepID=UPI0032170B3B
MSNLKHLSETFTLVGEALINKDLTRYVKTEPQGKNGWMKKSINLGVKISDTNRIYIGQEAGYWSDEAVENTKNLTGKDERGKSKKKENFIYNGETNDKGEWIPDNIPFADRFNKEALDKIPYYKKIRVSLEPEMINTNDNNGEIVQQIKKDANGQTVYKEVEFLFIGDAIDYIQKHLSHGQRIYVYGQTEINQYISKHDSQLKTAINRNIQQIRVAREDEENQAVGVTNFYFDKDSLDKSEFKKERKYYIQGYRTFKNDKKEIIPVPISYVIDCSNPNVDWEDEEVKARVDYLIDVFESAKKDTVYSTSWRYMMFEGSSEQELTEKDLSKDLQKRVKLGFITLEAAIKQVRGSGIGDKIKEEKLVMPLGEESRVEMEDYTLDDLISPAIEEQKVDKIESTVEKSEEVKVDVTKKFDDMFK